MNLISIFFLSLGVGLSGAVMPGPLLTVTIRESYRRGFVAGPLLVAGHAVLEGTLVVLLMLGLDRVVGNEVFFGVVGVAGGAFLFWMGLGMVLEVRRGGLRLEMGESSGGRSDPFLAGLTTSLSNPYWFMWWTTVGLSLVLSASRFAFWGIAAFFVGHILSDLLWYSSVSLTLDRGKNIFSQSLYKGLVGVCGVLLLFFGAYFALGVMR